MNRVLRVNQNMTNTASIFSVSHPSLRSTHPSASCPSPRASCQRPPGVQKAGTQISMLWCIRCKLLDEQLEYEIGFDLKYNYKEWRGLQERGEAACVKMLLTNAILWDCRICLEKGSYLNTNCVGYCPMQDCITRITIQTECKMVVGG